ncbi:MAG: cytoplasmic protein [Desulfobulbaceae bacterium]|nr:cytoplasmic protein [Desulfobulbaceae bacterium]
MTKVVFFVFRSDPTCFMHALLNALDLEEKGMWGEIVFEGESAQLIPLISQPGHFLYSRYIQAKNRGLFYGVCQFCAGKIGITNYAESEHIPLIGDMSGHPSMSEFIKQGYTIITL